MITSMARSGQRISHIIQAMQSSRRTASDLSRWFISNTCLGQKAAQIPHPLHHSVLMFSITSILLSISPQPLNRLNSSQKPFNGACLKAFEKEANQKKCQIFKAA
jgi:hypothetical protein